MVMRCFLLAALFLNMTSLNAQDYEGSRFSDVRDQVKSDPYDILPMTKVGVSTFYKKLKSLIYRDAKRTLSDRSDLLPPFQKLVHTVGTCLIGTWKITETSPYSGYFSQGKEALIILRASEAMGLPLKGNHRAFGLAGKIFPTTDENEIVETANFFTVDDLGGTKISDFTKTLLLNEPKLTIRYSDLNMIAIGLATAKAFNKADKNAGIRPLYPVSEMGLADGEKAKTPTYMMLKGSNETALVKEHKDFRNDLSLDNFENGLAFDILLRDSGDADWIQVGQIIIDDVVASESCDHRLHFNHPKSR